LKQIKSLEQDRGINSRVAHDLISNASRQITGTAEKVANLSDFDDINNYVHTKTMLSTDKLNNLKVSDTKDTSDLRSVRSEFDYGKKKTFTDVLGE
jgi:hypothetical protein